MEGLAHGERSRNGAGSALGRSSLIGSLAFLSCRAGRCWSLAACAIRPQPRALLPACRPPCRQTADSKLRHASPSSRVDPPPPITRPTCAFDSRAYCGARPTQWCFAAPARLDRPVRDGLQGVSVSISIQLTARAAHYSTYNNSAADRLTATVGGLGPFSYGDWTEVQ